MAATDASNGPLTLLLAEDNPHVQGLLVRAFEPLANVIVITDGADALLRAAEQLPDIVVADFTLPGLDGLRLLEKLRSRAPTSNIGCVLMAPRTDLEQLPGSAKQLADEIVEKPFLVADAVAAVRRVSARIELQRAIGSGLSTASAGSMRGRLSQLSFVDLLQALEMGGKTCRLVARSGSELCEIFVERGAVIYAACAGHRGDDAVFAALAWPDGEFEIDFAATDAPPANVQRSTQALLMDGLRLLDESRHAAATEDVLEDL